MALPIGPCAGCHEPERELVEDLCAACWAERHDMPLRVFAVRWQRCRMRPLVLEALWRQGQRVQKRDAASRAAAALPVDPAV